MFDECLGDSEGKKVFCFVFMILIVTLGNLIVNDVDPYISYLFVTLCIVDLMNSHTHCMDLLDKMSPIEGINLSIHLDCFKVHIKTPKMMISTLHPLLMGKLRKAR